jgi:hypothetical protein
MKMNIANTDQKVAHNTGDGWLLQYQNKDGDYYPEEGFDWPDEWPDSVSASFLEERGFEIV